MKKCLKYFQNGFREQIFTYKLLRCIALLVIIWIIYISSKQSMILYNIITYNIYYSLIGIHYHNILIKLMNIKW